MSILFRAIPLLLAAVFLIAADEPPAADVVAQRGDVRLTSTDLKDTLSLLDPAARAQVTATPQSLANFVRERVLNLAVLSEAEARKWDTQPDVARRINEARDAVILQTYLTSLVPPDPAYPSEADVATAYENNKSRLVLPRQFHIAQIVLTVKPDATPQDEEAVHKKALDIRAQAVRPKADFADLARKNSQEQPSAQNGGDVGWLREPDMMPSVREVVQGMTENSISQPLKVPDGWHILKLLAIKPGGQVALQDAREQIVQALRQARAQRLIRAHLDEMLKAQPIQVNEIELTKQVSGGK
jgi:peptidylprolyl isomerase